MLCIRPLATSEAENLCHGRTKAEELKVDVPGDRPGVIDMAPEGDSRGSTLLNACMRLLLENIHCVVEIYLVTRLLSRTTNACFTGRMPSKVGSDEDSGRKRRCAWV